MWAAFFALIAVLLFADLALLRRGDRAASLRSALLGFAAWVALAVGFGGWLGVRSGGEAVQQYFAGYLIELSLSVDNLFIFILIFERFKVPPAGQHRVLFWGILGAIILRTGILAAGVGAVARFHWLLFVFGAFILATGLRLALARPKPEGRGRVAAGVARLLEGRSAMKPAIAALIAIEMADLVFALDSMPAVLAVTHDAFIAVSSNVFAVLGLRSLYLVVSGALRRFRFLRPAVALLLVLVGAKMLAEPWVRIGAGASLGIIAAVVAAAMGASLVWPKEPPSTGGAQRQRPDARTSGR